MLRYDTDGELHHQTAAAASKRIRTKANGRENKRTLQSKQTSWVGSFRTVRSIYSHRGGSELMQTVADYTSARRIRRQTSIQKQNYYRLLTPDAPGVSPIGSVAKLLMQSVLKSKNKTTKDVVP